MIPDLDTIRLESDGPVLTARIDNPPTDLLDAAVIADLGELTLHLAKDSGVRALVLAGPRPGVFVPHYLIDDILTGTEQLGMATPYAAARAGLAAVAGLSRLPGARSLLAATPAAGLLDLVDTHRTLNRLGRLPQVVIAAIDGDALGGGCELALACDIRIMSRGDYRIGLPELSAGIPPGAGGTQRLMAAVGPLRARALILGAQTLSPDEALGLGLVDSVVAPAELAGVVAGIADTVSGWNPAAVAAAKRALRPPDLAAGLRRESGGFVAAVSGSDAIEHLRRFTTASRSESGRTPWRDRSFLPARFGVSRPASAQQPAPRAL